MKGPSYQNTTAPESLSGAGVPGSLLGLALAKLDLSPPSPTSILAEGETVLFSDECGSYSTHHQNCYCGGTQTTAVRMVSAGAVHSVPSAREEEDALVLRPLPETYASLSVLPTMEVDFPNEEELHLAPPPTNEPRVLWDFFAKLHKNWVLLVVSASRCMVCSKVGSQSWTPCTTLWKICTTDKANSCIGSSISKVKTPSTTSICCMTSATEWRLA